MDMFQMLIHFLFEVSSLEAQQMMMMQHMQGHAAHSI